MKVIFICKERSIEGYSLGTYGLWNSARMVCEYLQTTHTIESDIYKVVDANDVNKVVYETNPDVVVIEALWITPEKLKEIMSQYHSRNRTWIVRIHSRWSFLSNEGVAVEWLHGYRQLQNDYNLYIAPNTFDMARDCQYKLNIKTIYLPNIYFSSTPLIISNCKPSSQVINIGCFGSIRPLKNQLIQAIAGITLAEDLDVKAYFHINSNRVEQRGDPILKNMRSLFENSRHSLVEHDWLDYNDFIRLVRNMDIGLQVSYTETFNIVAADFIWNGVPLVASSSIDWMPPLYQADTNSIDDIVEKAYRMYVLQRGSVKYAQGFLNKNITNAKVTWVKTLKALQ